VRHVARLRFRLRRCGRPAKFVHPAMVGETVQLRRISKVKNMRKAGRSAPRGRPHSGLLGGGNYGCDGNMLLGSAPTCH